MGIISSIINILFEIWFVYYNLIKIKNIKDKKYRLYIGLLLSFVISSIVIGFTYKNQIYMMVLNAAITYLFMKLLYKTKIQIPDIFLIYFVNSIILFTAIISQLILGYTMIALIIDRIILLLMVLLGTKHITNWYKNYINNWNRGKGHKIKSITLRNISILFMNITIFIINNYILYYFLNLLKK